MAKSRYYKSAPGLNAEIMIAKAAYAADADYKAFVADDSNESVIGIFDAETLLLKTSPLAEGDKFFFAQKRDKGTFKSTTFVYKSADLKKVAYTAPVKQVSTVTFASTYVPAVNDELVISVIETTPGNQPFPRWNFNVQAKAGESRALLLARLVAKINDASDIANGDLGVVVTAVLVGDAIILTGVHFGSAFRIALQEKAYEVATAATPTNFKQGSGYYDHVVDLELQGQIFEGVTTQYPNQNATNAEFGTPSNFATAGVNYNIYQVSAVRRGHSPIPAGENVHNHNFILAAPNSWSAAIDTVLGF